MLGQTEHVEQQWCNRDLEVGLASLICQGSLSCEYVTGNLLVSYRYITDNLPATKITGNLRTLVGIQPYFIHKYCIVVRFLVTNSP